MIITKKALPRRTFLRGIGGTLALPLLDAMVPAGTALAQTAAHPVRRFGVAYFSNGLVMRSWTPATTGKTFELTPLLKPFEPVRDKMLVISGLDNIPKGSAHAGRSTGFLTGVTAGDGLTLSRTGEYDISASISADQIMAQEAGKQTQLPSLEAAMESRDTSGSCDAGYSCVYTNTISWRGPKTPLPMEHNPRAIFEQLFGDAGSTDARARQARIKQQRSVLDSLLERVSGLERELGPHDQSRLNEYLDAVRDVETRIQKAEEQSSRELPVLDQPPGVPASYEEHAHLMFDLQLLAYQSDLTRVITFMMSREVSGRSYPEIGVPEAHHPTSHHREEPELIAKLQKINAFHLGLFADYVKKLAATPDGDGSLLDHMMLLAGAGMSDSNRHDPTNLPVMLFGGGFGTPMGRYISYPKGTPFTNLVVTMLDKFGTHVDRLGGSNGKIEFDSVSL